MTTPEEDHTETPVKEMVLELTKNDDCGAVPLEETYDKKLEALQYCNAVKRSVRKSKAKQKKMARKARRNNRK